MAASVVALAAASTFAALVFPDVVAYLDDGTTLCGLLSPRLSALNWEF